MDDTIGEKTWNEINKKIKSLYPAFVISFLISFCLDCFFYGGNIFEKFSASIGELSLLVGAGFIFDNSMYIGPIWYFSDLLIVILLLFPMMTKYNKIFSTIIAPTIVIFGYGYLYILFKHLAITVEPLGIICGGILRGLCGVSLGNIMYYLARKKVNLTIFGENVLKIVQCLLLIICVYFMNEYSGNYYDFIEILIFAILILFAFKFSVYNKRIFDNKIIYVLGEYSAILYVVHYSLIRIPKNVWPKKWESQYIMWIIMTNVLSIVVFMFNKKILPRIRQQLMKSFFVEDNGCRN